MGLAAWKHQVDMYLYYELGAWSAFATPSGYLPMARPETLKPTMELTDLRYASASYDGEALLIVPGPNGMLSTLHFEGIRDGLEDYEYYTLLSQLVANATARGIDVRTEAARLQIPNAVFAHVHNGNCADSMYAYNTSRDKNYYPHDILWSEDPTVQRRQRTAVAAAIVSVRQKLRAAHVSA